MIGSFKVMHELICAIPSVIQISSISSINSIRLRFNLGKPGIIPQQIGDKISQMLFYNGTIMYITTSNYAISSYNPLFQPQFLFTSRNIWAFKFSDQRIIKVTGHINCGTVFT